jgi:uncharacterized protein YkwD
MIKKGTSIFIMLVMVFTMVFAVNTLDVSAASKNVSLKVRGEVNYSYAYKVLNLINKERSKRGIKKLKMTTALMKVANTRAAELTVLCSHSRPNGKSDPSDMYKWKNAFGENIAINTTPESVVESWMNSPNHKKNILSKDYKSVGIGCFVVNNQCFWVQDFVGNSASATAKKPANKTKTYTISTKKTYVNFSKQNLNISFKNKKAKKVAPHQISIVYGVVEHSVPLHYSCIQFKSSNTKVAKVDKYGKVTPVKNGSAKITAYIKGYSAKKVKWNVTVNI